jgi:hypothetical protein
VKLIDLANMIVDDTLDEAVAAFRTPSRPHERPHTCGRSLVFRLRR